ncbi:LytR C-terminal domain-containing protein [Paramicrobacterium chengjingii]|uniref:LytR C-terminal domain-containing protein n=1 Tax=Paramicrobacterium chengjingii TaxID=2769067 RepID=A0ABX6YG01_9MICO|nr:LytR C-terminal domain-containing protein [Microbacterium chengjingii]QPZ37366.1 LytR C-terminal domain-containing protein [Microbacterium chengjingii]
MGSSHPQDRFDDVPHSSRVGAHRAPGRRSWVGFLWAAIATIVLIALGIFGLSIATDRLNLDQVIPGSSEPSETPTPTQTTQKPTVEPTIDPEALIQVLNGTTTVGLASDVKAALGEGGWTASNVTASNASDDSLEKTVIYYDDDSLEAAARGVAQTLGVEAVEYSTEFSVGDVPQIVVVLGSDYVAEG